MTIVEAVEIKLNTETKEVTRTTYTIYVEPMIRQLIELRNQGIDLLGSDSADYFEEEDHDYD